MKYIVKQFAVTTNSVSIIIFIKIVNGCCLIWILLAQKLMGKVRRMGTGKGRFELRSVVAKGEVTILTYHTTVSATIVPQPVIGNVNFQLFPLCNIKQHNYFRNVF